MSCDRRCEAGLAQPIADRVHFDRDVGDRIRRREDFFIFRESAGRTDVDAPGLNSPGHSRTNDAGGVSNRLRRYANRSARAASRMANHTRR